MFITNNKISSIVHLSLPNWITIVHLVISLLFNLSFLNLARLIITNRIPFLKLIHIIRPLLLPTRKPIKENLNIHLYEHSSSDHQLSFTEVENQVTNVRWSIHIACPPNRYDGCKNVFLHVSLKETLYVAQSLDIYPIPLSFAI